MNTTYLSNYLKVTLLAFALGICITGGLISGCDFDQSDVIQKKIQVNVDNFRRKHYTECQSALLRDAEQIVDSLLLTEAQAQLRDSLSRSKPFKPVQPPDVPPIDSLNIKPIFDK